MGVFSLKLFVLFNFPLIILNRLWVKSNLKYPYNLSHKYEDMLLI